MYCPPESGNIDPSSAKAKQAHSEIRAPNTQTSRNKTGCGRGPAISLAVRKIDDPMMPLTNRSTESSRLSPRTSVGLDSGDETSTGTTEAGSVIPCPVRPRIQVEYRNAGRSRQNNLRRSADHSRLPSNSGNRVKVQAPALDSED